MLRPFLVLLSLLALLVLCLLLERLVLERGLRRLKIRVAVTGTRGKSSVTRLIAGALREADYRALAKTTGSAATVIRPDGSEREISRLGPPTVLEGRKILGLARHLKADALVAEMMSVRPEYLAVESSKLLKPHLLVITNVRLDHREEMGRTRTDVARSLSSAIRRGCTVIVPEDDVFPVFEQAANRVAARILRVPAAPEKSLGEVPDSLLRYEMEENIRLALVAAELMGLSRTDALLGMARAKPDLGGLRVWRANLGTPPAAWLLASLFAANEPDSTARVLAKLDALCPMSTIKRIAILNLRPDREDRTAQWMDSLQAGFFKNFESVAIVGLEGGWERRARRLTDCGGTKVSVYHERSAEGIMRRLASGPSDSEGSILVGMGNMGGLGRRLVERWDRLGTPLDRTETPVA